MSVFALKLVALITMVIDHIGLVFSEAVAVPLFSGQIVYLMRATGRVAFPLYAFLLVEGFRHTRDWRRYALRLLGLGVLSQIPYAFTTNAWIKFSEMPQWRRVTDLNILFTLALGVLMLAFLSTKRFEKAFASWGAAAGLAALSVLFYVSAVYDVAIVLGIAAALTFASRFAPKLRYAAGQASRFALFVFLLLWFMRKNIPVPGGVSFYFEYGVSAFVLFAALYWAGTPRRSAVVIALWGLWSYWGNLGGILLTAVAAVFAALYNGQKGRNDHRLFYWAYPAHLFILWGLLALLT